MKNFTNILFFALCVLLASCFKPEIAPPLESDLSANMTIAEFQKLHTLSTANPAVTLITDSICMVHTGTNDIILSGHVVSTDQFGSCYREIFFTDGTAGMSILTSNSAYYNKYPIGQLIFVKPKDLYLGNYVNLNRNAHGFYQIGILANGGIFRLPPNIEKQSVFRFGTPVPRTAPKVIKTINDIEAKDYSTFVKIENCKFRDADGTTKFFVPTGTLSTISQPLELLSASGQTMNVRISQYCTFANDTLPRGTLNVSGILSFYYNTNYPNDPPQLILCSIEDIEKVPPAPPAKILAKFDMSENPFTLGWKNEQKLGTTVWEYNQTSKNVNIYESENVATDCWLVSPKFNFAGEKEVTLSFTHRLINGKTDNAKLWYTVNGTDWELLNFDLIISATNEVIVKLNDQITTSPNLQIAFQYKTTTDFPR